MNRSASYILFATMIPIFAVLTFLIISSLYGRQRDINDMVREHNRLVRQVDRERPETDRLLQEILALEEKAARRLTEKGELIEKLQDESEKALFSEVYSEGIELEESRVRELAALPVSELAGRFIAAIEGSDKLTIALLSAAMREKPDESFEYLSTAAASTDDKSLKFSYFFILTRLRDRRTLSIFQNVLTDKSETDTLVRRAAASGLVALPDESSVPVLIDVLQNSSDWGIKTNAAAALGLIKDSRAIEPLKKEFAQAQNAMVRNFALLALAHIADPQCTAYFASIAGAASEESHAVIAIQGLHRIGSPDAQKALRELASKDSGPASEEAKRLLESDDNESSENTKGSDGK